MNKEIEEIIEYFRNEIKWIEEELKNPHYLGNYITIRDKEYEYLKQLLDYITILEEDNKMYAQLKDEYEDIINKAIEYIKETACYITDGKNKEMCVDDINYDECMELLRILRGEDNE